MEALDGLCMFIHDSFILKLSPDFNVNDESIEALYVEIIDKKSKNTLLKNTILIIIKMQNICSLIG